MSPASPRPARLLLLGVSARALADSAAASRVAADLFPGRWVALDFFGDADLRALAVRRPLEVLAIDRDLGLPRTTAALGRAALALDWDAAVFASGLENRPGILRRMGRRGRLLGNGWAAVRDVRNPALVLPFLRERGYLHPPTWTDGASAPAADGPLLLKPRRSGGGTGVRLAAPGERRPPGHYFQRLVEGRPLSAAFVADGRSAAILGVSEAIAGFRALGGSAFRYGGNIAAAPESLLSPAALREIAGLASSLAERFGLRGLNGVDLVVAGDRPVVLEINPRYTASMELIEERSGVNLFDLHLAACTGGRIPPGPPPAVPGAPPFLAKGILYADRPARLAEPPDRLAAIGARDLPARGERFRPGQPICSLLAAGATPAECRERLAARAREARRLLDPW